jgi:hypothetical protein
MYRRRAGWRSSPRRGNSSLVGMTAWGMWDSRGSGFRGDKRSLETQLGMMGGGRGCALAGCSVFASQFLDERSLFGG